MAEVHFDPAIVLSSRSGLRLELNANGSLRRFANESISLALFMGNELEGGPANLYLRRHGNPTQWVPLLGPRSGTRFQADPAGARAVGVGSWQGVDYTIEVALAQDATAWYWHVRLENTSSAPQNVDLTYAQDVALASYFAVRLNEFYVSQYLDHTALLHPERGFVVASRQNQAVDGRYPWSLIGSLRGTESYATDARQLHGEIGAAATFPGLTGELPSRRLQHEHAMVVVRDKPIQLNAGESAAAGFFGLLVADHPAATSSGDLDLVSRVLQQPEAQAASRSAMCGTDAAWDPSSLFSTAPALDSVDLDETTLQAHFGSQWRHPEIDARGACLSFFHDTHRHVTLRAKELRVLRPHGHLLRTGRHLTPDETALTSTVWMSGVFHSMVTQGHVSINRIISTVHSYLGLFRSHGQRVFMHTGGGWRLLETPSAFEMSTDSCRWIYKHSGGTVEVEAQAHSDPHELTLSIEITAGPPASFLISHHLALNGDDGSVPGKGHWQQQDGEIVLSAAPNTDLAQRFPHGTFRIAPRSGSTIQQVGGDELLFLDGQSRQQPFLCIVTGAVSVFGLRLWGNLICTTSVQPLMAESTQALMPRVEIRSTPESPLAGPLMRLADIAPWFAHNAFVHYLAPRGLEQYSGGGWGTRDVCQGPVEMLFALGRLEPIRDLLLRVLAAQNADGDWPQWFMFFDRERNIRAGDSHGDIIFWPLLVLSQYLLASGDSALLEARVHFFDSRGPDQGEWATVWEHALRALSLIEKRVIPGTTLATYGHGDWNDSLQPADPALRENMCSAWTVTLHYQTLNTLAKALRAVDRSPEAARLESWAANVLRDFQRLLVINGVLTGYAHFEQTQVRYLLHPSDRTTGVRYSSLAMIHAILEDMLTPEQTREHLKLIDEHLTAPDGVRLFDRPMSYHGGVQKIFQRAETATYFGREIGLMYMHAHLRYAQALAHVGHAERFFEALCQANPIAIRSIVPQAALRQSNCYYSSSDAAFDDRYQASEEYERIAGGTISLDGGWRVYSSGAGIALGLIVRRFLGLSWEFEGLLVDPVIPSALDGMRFKTSVQGHPLEVLYRVGSAGCGVKSLSLNGKPLAFTSRPNLHRGPAAFVAREAVLDGLTAGENSFSVDLD